MKFSYYIKTQPRLYLLAAVCITLVVVVTNVLLQDYGSWRMERVFIILLPVFFTANVISDEYEHRREGLLFVTHTPIYKHAFVKFVFGWLFTQIFIFLMFTSGYIVGMERDYSRWIVLLVYSTYLSLFGLTIANITRNSLYGFGAAVVYWIVMVTVGFSVNERMWPISIILNNDLATLLVWNNLVSLLALSYLLIVFNFWFIGKGERIRKRLTWVNCVLLLTVLATLGVYGYKENEQAQAPTRIINATKGQETLFLVATDNREVIKELDEMNVVYTRPEAVSELELSEHNIVLITTEEDESDSILIKDLLSKSNISMTETGIRAGKKEIYQADSFRTILSNVFNPLKEVVHLDSKNWTQQSIRYLLSAESGSFIALNQEVQGATSSYAKIDHLDKHLTLSNTGSWFVKRDGTAKVLYQKLSESQADEFLVIWKLISDQVNKMLPASMNVDVLQITKQNEEKFDSTIFPQLLKINYRTIKELEPSKFGGRDWLEEIAVSLLSQTIFKHVENKEIQFACSQYVFLNRLGSFLETEFGEEYWHTHYDYSLKDRAEALFEEGQALLQKKELLNAGNVNSVLYYLLYKVDNSPNADSLLQKVMLSKKGNERVLKNLLTEYTPASDVDYIFSIYN